MKTHIKWMGVFVTMLAVVLVGLPVGALTEAVYSQDKPELTTKPDPAREQQRLIKAIRHELLMLPYYSVFDNLAFRLDGYRVELSGQVTRPTLKSDAEKVVKDIEGVESVVNNIDVLPVSPNDDRIRRAVFRAIYSFPSFQRYAIQVVPPIHIIVNRGHVTLEGVVATRSDKNIADIKTKGVSGVFSVTNNLQVEMTGK